MIKAHLIKAAIKVAYSNARYSLYEIPKGILKCQKKLNNKDTHYMVICDHIGDFLITMGYMKAYRERNHIKHITICTTQKMLSLLKCYVHFYDEYMTLTSEELYEILKVGSTRFGCRALRKMPNITLLNPGNAFVLEYFEYIKRFPNVSLHDCIKYGSLCLDKECEFIPPKLRLYSRQKYEKTILLCPDAQFLRNNHTFVRKITNELKKDNYRIYTNTPFPEDKVIEGTKKKTLSLIEVCEFAFNGGIVIGIRSGLFDLLSYVPGKIIANYPDEEYFSLFNLYSLPNTKADVLQVFEKEDEQKTMDKIKSFIGGEEWL